MEKGYSVVAYTDHNVLIPHPELTGEDFVALNGYEIEVNQDREQEGYNPHRPKTCHICLIALEPDNVKQVCFHRTRYLRKIAQEYIDIIEYDKNEPDYERYYSHEGVNDIMKKGRDNGFFVTYNHPRGSLEQYYDYIGYNYMHAMEIVNYDSILCGNPEYCEREYDDMLLSGKRIYCIATDDSHSLEGCFGGFTIIKADKLEYRTITKALENGDFYASEGPKINDLWFEDGVLHVDCENVREIRFNTGGRRAKAIRADDGEFVNSGEFNVEPNDVYVRVTITDASGKHANTNAYFTDELLKEI